MAVPPKRVCFFQAEGRGPPTKPHKDISSLASRKRALARKTNIDRRLLTAANTSRRQTSHTVSGAWTFATKVACMRPLALQKAQKRTASAGTKARSWVSWLCKKETASLPLTSITPKWGNSHAPWKWVGGKRWFGLRLVMG